MRTKHYQLVGALAIAVCSTVGLAGCGGDDDENKTNDAPAEQGGGGSGDAASEYCATIDDLIAKIKGGDASAMSEAATLGAQAAELTDPDQAARAAECAAKLTEAMTP